MTYPYSHFLKEREAKKAASLSKGLQRNHRDVTSQQKNLLEDKANTTEP